MLRDEEVEGWRNGKGGRKRKDTWKEGQNTQRAAHSAHLGLIVLLNVLAVLRNELLVLLTHIIEDLGEIRAWGNIYLHTNVSIILTRQLLHLLPGKKRT